jgi:hypothetical protein
LSGIISKKFFCALVNLVPQCLWTLHRDVSRIKEYVADFMKTYKKTKSTDPSAREKAVKIVKAYGPPIAAWYGVGVTQGTDFKKIEKNGTSSYSLETKITESETELLMKVLEKEFKV